MFTRSEGPPMNRHDGKPRTEAEMQSEMDYLTFCNAKRMNLESAAIVGHFGSGAAARMELRWAAEQLMERVASIPDESVGELSKDERREIPHSYSDPGQYCSGCSSRTCWCGQSRLTSRSEYNGDRR